MSIGSVCTKLIIMVTSIKEMLFEETSVTKFNLFLLIFLIVILILKLSYIPFFFLIKNFTNK